MAAAPPPNATVATKPKRSWPVRLARGLGWTLLVLLVLPLLLWSALQLGLHTEWAQEKIARLAVEQAKGALAGELSLKDVRVRGALQVCATQLELRDPSGVPALSAQQLCVSLALRDLLHRQLHVTALELRAPALFLTGVVDEKGVRTTSLARALAARTPKPEAPAAAPTAWTVVVDALLIHDGLFEQRERPDAKPVLSFAGLELGPAKARWAATGAAATLSLSGELKLKGTAPVKLSLDALLDGGPADGTATLRSLALRLGQSGFVADGSVALGTLAGALHLRELVLQPADLDGLLGEGLLAAELRGEAELLSDGKELKATVRVQTERGGRIALSANSTIAEPPRWSLRLESEHVDPSFLIRQGPRGRVSLWVELAGKGIPKIDEHGLDGEVRGKLHLGPAELRESGALSADADFSLHGRSALIKSLTADGLAVHVSAQGQASLREIALDLQVNATDLARFSRALGALQHQRPLPLSGSATLVAHATGSPKAPDAQVHLKAPRLGLGAGLSVLGLAIDGTLSGDLAHPDGELTASSTSVALGGIGLGSPKIAATLDWPRAHLEIDAQVGRQQASGEPEALHFEGDAQLDDDRDGAELSDFVVSWPGSVLAQQAKTRVHFRKDETVLEPFALAGEHGALSLAGILRPPKRSAAGKPLGEAHLTGKLEALGLELGSLPAFAVPPSLQLAGRIDLRAALGGTLGEPEVKASLALHDLSVQQLQHVDGTLEASLEHQRLEAQLKLTGLAGATLALRASVPIRLEPGEQKLELEASLGPLDLAKASAISQRQQLILPHPSGTATLHLQALGTLDHPRATLTLDGQRLTWNDIAGVGLHLQASAEQERIKVETRATLFDETALTLEAESPFDLGKALRDTALFSHLLEKPSSLKLRVPELKLAQLARAHLGPAGASGVVTAALDLTGTESEPQLALHAVGTQLQSGQLAPLNVKVELLAAQRLKFELEATPGGDAQAKLSASAAVSASELVLAARQGFPARLLEPLFERALGLELTVDKLVIGSLATLEQGQVALPLLGELDGKLSGSGTANDPKLEGKLSLRSVEAGTHKLGNADVYVELNRDGATLHLGLDPPGTPQHPGGHLLLHGMLQAPLVAKTLLDQGLDPIAEGNVDAHVKMQGLDLAFLSGIAPALRRTGGVVDGEIEIKGLLGHPEPTGEAHLRGGIFDVVGQGIVEDFSVDATFAPKEIVLDRFTGSTGGGTFSGTLVLDRKVGATAEEDDHFEFTGELHAGDDESVRERFDHQHKPLQSAPVPLRQGGEVRADLTAEVDFFGDYEGGNATATVKIPDSAVRVRSLPDKKLPSLSPNPEVLVSRKGEEPHPAGIDPLELKKQKDAMAKLNLRLDVKFDLDQLRVSANDFDFPVNSKMHLSWDAQHADAPSADGTIEVKGGTFSALGRRFSIDQARITETGGDIADPELEIQARYENAQAAVLVLISGTAKDPQIDLSSSPSMDQDAIAFFLATGRVQGHATEQGSGVDLSGAATSVVGAMLFGKLRANMADIMPVDTVDIEAGSAEQPAQAAVGKYIGERIYVGYRQRFAPAPTENANEGNIEYEIARGFGANVTFGEKNQNAMVTYTKDF